MSTRSLNLTRLGWGLAIAVTFLAVVGIANIHATDESIAETAAANVPAGEQQDAAPLSAFAATLAAIGPLTLRQILYFVGGIALLVVTLLPSYRKIGEYAFVAYGFVLLLLLALLVDKYGRHYGIDLPFISGSRTDTVWRWIRIGPISIQPSELMKVALILALARYLRYRDSYRTWVGLIPPFLLTIIPMALILKQPDLGTLLMLLPVLFAMLFVAGARIRHLAIIVAMGMVTLPVFYFFGMQDYQKNRVLVLLKQNTEDAAWQTGPGYQLRQGLTALGTGRITGQGFGGSAFIRRGLLPEEHNDFIFALIGNQWGFVGCLLVILSYVLIIILGLEVALMTNDPFGRLLAVGVVAMIVTQALLNICMNMGLAPITGMTLPFVSFGGSSLWSNFIALGLLVNVAQRRPMLMSKPPFEHDGVRTQLPIPTRRKEEIVVVTRTANDAE